MDIKELIESGSLELYVMGALPADETREIDALRKQHRELNDEILRIEDAMIAYADSHAVKPNHDLKEKIAEKLSFSVGLDLEEEKVSSVVIQMPGIYRYAAAAAVLLIIGLSGTTFYFYSKYSETSSQLLALQSNQTQLANQVKFIETKADKLKNELAVATNPENKRIALAGLKISPASKAVIYWDKETGNTYLNSELLPPVATNEQYQLWAIVDGKPVDLGVVNKETAFNQMKQVQNASAFAITLEPLGGRPSPTMEKMYVMGAV